MCLCSRLFIIIIIIIIIIAVVVVVGFCSLCSVIFMTIMNLLKWTLEESRLQTFCDTLDNIHA